MSQSSDSEYEDAESIHSDYQTDDDIIPSINQNESSINNVDNYYKERIYNNNNSNNNNNINNINVNIKNNNNLKKKKKSLNEHFLTVDVSRHNSATSPLGIQLAPITLYEKSFVIIAGWDHLPNTRKLGIIQKSGLIRLGDVLVLINDVSVKNTTFRKVMNLLKNLMESNMLQSLTFCPSKEYYKDLVATASSSSSSVNNDTSLSNNNSNNVSRASFSGSAAKQRGRYVFFSTINTFRKVEKDDEGNVIPIADTTYVSKQTYVEYEVSCYLLLRGVTSAQAVATPSSSSDALSDGQEIRWSIWKRFSEFKTLDTALRQTYGWQMNAITNDGNNDDSSPFPSSHPLSSFFLSNHRNSQEFLEKRCLELDNYWQAILQIEEMTDFTQSHRYSRDLANFLSVKEHLQNVMKSSSTSNTNISSQSLIENNDKHNDNNNASMSSQHKSFQERRSRRNLDIFEEDDAYNNSVYEQSSATKPSFDTMKKQQQQHDSIIDASELSSKKIIPLRSPYERRLYGCFFNIDIMCPRTGRKK